MDKPLSSWLLRGAAMVCFIDAASLPKDWSNAVLAGVLGFLLLVRGASSVPQRVIVVISAWVLALVVTCNDQGIINMDEAFWVLVILAAGAIIIFAWRKEIE